MVPAAECKCPTVRTVVRRLTGHKAPTSCHNDAAIVCLAPPSCRWTLAELIERLRSGGGGRDAKPKPPASARPDADQRPSVALGGFSRVEVDRIMLQMRPQTSSRRTSTLTATKTARSAESLDDASVGDDDTATPGAGADAASPRSALSSARSADEADSQPGTARSDASGGGDGGGGNDDDDDDGAAPPVTPISRVDSRAAALPAGAAVAAGAGTATGTRRSSLGMHVGPRNHTGAPPAFAPPLSPGAPVLNKRV